MNIKLLLQRLPPPGSEPPHGPDDARAGRRDDRQHGEEPSRTDGRDERLGDDAADAGEQVAAEGVEGDEGGGFVRHEFRQHRRRHVQDQDAARADEEGG